VVILIIEVLKFLRSRNELFTAVSTSLGKKIWRLSEETFETSKNFSTVKSLYYLQILMT